MKHLKVFESFKDSDYYQVVDHDVADYKFNHCLVNIPTDEFDELSRYFHDWLRRNILE